MTQPSDAAVRDAVRALRTVAPDADALEDAVYAAASTLAATPGGWPDTASALSRAFDAALRHAWEGGWQPADVDRLARRRLDAVAAELCRAAIRAEARHYTAATLPPRWAAQLRELGGGPVEADLDALARRRRLTRFETAAHALTALHLIDTLPRIGAIGPLPGAPVAPARPASVPPKTLSRIRALLAKAESTDYAEEAEALSAKAQELMARHCLDEALLAATAEGPSPGGPAACRIGVEGPYEGAKALLLDAVATANHCQSVWSGEHGFATLVGFESDLELSELMYTSLLVQATAAMRGAADALPRALGSARAGGTPISRGRSRRTRDFRESFLIAYAGRIGDRLAAAVREVTERESRAEALPVLAAREVAVGEATGRLFPRTTAHRLKGRDPEGWASGVRAADRARLR
ncbi:DUF2786 domain-containing protein [Streptomyces orinoci]|uniref:DUF2786 domain-containing protein n=1 Tax=Streptomyces orinoci TaxID=67339 RepID=A0ABV3JSC8_STRON|nr:DUF2786 domain-containing protein [Streptomyces orinoci]